MPFLPAVTLLTANAPALRPVLRAGELQQTPLAAREKSQSGDFAALMESFTDAAPSSSIQLLPGLQVMNNVPLALNSLPEKLSNGAKAEPLKEQFTETKHGVINKDEKPEERDLTPEIDVSNVQPLRGSASADPQEEVLPFVFNLPSNASQQNSGNNGTAQLEETHLEPEREASRRAGSSLPKPSDLPAPPAGTPQLRVPVERQTQDFELALPAADPVEVLGALTLRDVFKTTLAPKAKMAFEVHLKQDSSRTDRQSPPLMPENPQADGEVTTGAESVPRDRGGASSTAAIAGPGVSIRSGIASNTPSHVGNDSGSRDTESEPIRKQTVNGPNEDHAPDRKSNAVEAAYQPPARHTAEPLAEPSTTPVAQHAPKQAESVKVTEKPLLSTAPQHDIPESAPPRTEPVRDISFRIASSNANPVDIRLTERAGEIRVAVHAADPVLTRSLQSNVAELAGKLERSGFHTETFLPNRAEAVRDPQSAPNFQDAPKDRKAPQYEPQRPKKQTRSGETKFQINMLNTTQQEK